MVEPIVGIDLLPEATLLVTTSGEICAANLAARRLLVDQTDDVTGIPLSNFIAEPEATVSSFLRESSRASHLLPATLRIRTAAGPSPVVFRAEAAIARARPEVDEPIVMVRLRPRDESIRRFVKLSQRITALSGEIAIRKQLSDTLREQRQWWEVTVGSIADGVIVTDVEGCIEFMNPVAEGLTGWNSDEGKGQSFADVFQVVDEATHDPLQIPLASVLHGATFDGLGDHAVLIARNGTEIPVSDSAAAINDGERGVRGMVIVFRDETSRRELRRDIERAAAELVDRAQRRDEFLVMLSHELRNPLAPLRNGIELLRTMHAKDPASLQIGDLLNRQILHLTRLVDDLLDVARITHGFARVRREPVRVAEAMEHAVEIAQPLIDTKGHDLTLETPPDDAFVNGDKQRLTQAFANLLVNAAQFTMPGGRILFSCELSEGEAVLRVRDNGAGISAEFLPYAFDVFSQWDRSLDRTPGGLGIGLRVVKGIVELHGGTVNVTSEGLDRGTEFVLRLPLLLDTDPGTQPSSSPSGQGTTP